MTEKTNVYSFDLGQASPSVSFTTTQRISREAEILRAEATYTLFRAAGAAIKRLFTRTPKAEIAEPQPTEHKLAA